MRSSRTGAGTILLVLAMAIIGACSAPVGHTPTVSDPWVRPPMGADLPAAGYLTIVGGTENDALIAASSPVAQRVEIHETMAGASGMTGMQPVEQIEVAAGSTVTLEPGGYHLMLMGVTEELAVGSTVELTLTFETAGDIVIQAAVRAG